MNKHTFILYLYSITLTCILGFLALSNFTFSKNFDEISVERINIVQPDGKLVMVISNSERQHPGMLDGNILQERERDPGMIFFNEEQDEVGGLSYNGNKDDGAGMALSFDQYKNDQIMQVQYLQNENGIRQYGLNLWDRDDKFPLSEILKEIDLLKDQGVTDNDKILEALQKKNNGQPLFAQRLFLGKNYDKNVGLFVKDSLGKDRIKLYINEKNQPKFQILNESGKVVKEITLDK